MESSKGSGDRPKAEDVISKLKDDGDFDDLRLKIVRKIKENVSPLLIELLANVSHSCHFRKPSVRGLLSLALIFV